MGGGTPARRYAGACGGSALCWPAAARGTRRPGRQGPAPRLQQRSRTSFAARHKPSLQRGLRCSCCGKSSHSRVSRRSQSVPTRTQSSRRRQPVKAAPAKVVPDDPVPLEEVVVAASRLSRCRSEIPNTHTVFTQDEIRQLPRLADDSLKAVHRLPAAASNGVSGLAYMRGGANNETLVTLDGFPLYEPFHLKLLLSPTSLLDPGILSTAGRACRRIHRGLRRPHELRSSRRLRSTRKPTSTTSSG